MYNIENVPRVDRVEKAVEIVGMLRKLPSVSHLRRNHRLHDASWLIVHVYDRFVIQDRADLWKDGFSECLASLKHEDSIFVQAVLSGEGVSLRRMSAK